MIKWRWSQTLLRFPGKGKVFGVRKLRFKFQLCHCLLE